MLAPRKTTFSRLPKNTCNKRNYVTGERERGREEGRGRERERERGGGGSPS